MSLSQALNTSLSGLRVTQAGLSLVASNVANAQTLSYIRKTLSQEAVVAGDSGSSVRILAINRELDQFVQRQMRVEMAGGSYADMRAQFYQRLQLIYGEPGSDSALETVYNKFISAVQALVTSPDSTAARGIVLSSAQVLAQHLNGMTNDLQALRGDAESALAAAAASANEAMAKIAAINGQLLGSSTGDATTAALLDQRDFYIDQLAQLMDVRVVAGENNQVSVFTTSGVQLVGSDAARLLFNAQGTMTPATLWNADPSKSNVGTLTLVSLGGSTVDLIATKAIRSGEIAALIEMRDNILVQAQNQLDAIAAAMAQALSDFSVDGAAVSVGAQSGYELDVGGLMPGNSLSVTYTDNVSGTQHRVTIVRVDDPATLPLPDTATADPNDEVIGIDFSAGLASVVSQLNAQFGGLLQFSNPSGTMLRVLDDGAPDQADVDAFSITQTATALNGNTAALPFFTDGAVPYTGTITSVAWQSLGFAGRIAVNPALLADPSKLVLFGSNPAAGDATRPDFIFQRLAETSYLYPPETGLGSSTAPLSGTLPTYLRQMLAAQGEAAAGALRLAQGQEIVVNALRQRLSDRSGVNIDQEMAHLIALQTAYAANARVMSTVRDMIDALLNI
jgi:flagellar hook-associated protein 1 FlgK